ncbi:hypothetical protein P4O66_015478 [Electrophorus voltai]|uniref:Staphylococcal nuclease domain-containing protein n=1 Tax=Electrophorus voltai TaxID=2609070 RepID=A0AAD8YZE1_9TELE|nr:hypothetical protein P4O66_015478 [Electrophorus voltai]
MATSVSAQVQGTSASVPVLQRGIVKMVLSGCAIIVRGQPRGGPPPERQINLSNVRAGALARRAAQSQPDVKDTPDEPWAFQAREFLRKKMIGKEVCFTVEVKTLQGREYGMVYLGKDTSGENIAESLVAEGLAVVRREGIRGTNPEQVRLCDLEDQAKAAKRGQWSEGGGAHTIRDLKYSIENPRHFVDSLHQKPVNAIIEHVRDGSVVRALLLPDYYLVTVMLSGVKCPTFKREADGSETPEPFAAEAKFFTESRLLQRDVQIILESCPNQIILGTILHPVGPPLTPGPPPVLTKRPHRYSANGNITELLLKEGFARCVDWSMAVYTQGAEKLRAAERSAKERKVRMWKDYVAPTANLDQKDRQFVAKVMQVVNADAIVVKLNSGEYKTIHLSSIRPPRIEGEGASMGPKTPTTWWALWVLFPAGIPPRPCGPVMAGVGRWAVLGIYCMVYECCKRGLRSAMVHFFVSVPPPTLPQEKNKDKDKRFRPLYDIPYMFEAREFLRKKLIGKKMPALLNGAMRAPGRGADHVCLLGNGLRAEAALVRPETPRRSPAVAEGGRRAHEGGHVSRPNPNVGGQVHTEPTQPALSAHVHVPFFSTAYLLGHGYGGLPGPCVRLVAWFHPGVLHIKAQVSLTVVRSLPDRPCHAVCAARLETPNMSGEPLFCTSPASEVNVMVDYIRAATAGAETGPVPAFPERTCATVTIGGINIAEALISKGLATVIRYRQDDDQRSSHYDELLAAEARAIKNGKGLHSKKEVPIHRVADISGETQKAKQFLPFLQRAGRSEAVVEYVFSGSRLKLYMPKETCLITFLLAGIECPRGSRNIPGGIAEPFSEEAMLFTKELVLQREHGCPRDDPGPGTSGHGRPSRLLKTSRSCSAKRTWPLRGALKRDSAAEHFNSHITLLSVSQLVTRPWFRNPTECPFENKTILIS